MVESKSGNEIPAMRIQGIGVQDGGAWIKDEGRPRRRARDRGSMINGDLGNGKRGSVY